VTKVVAIIQARMTSTRLPGKVLADLAGRPLLEHVIARTAQARCIDQVAVATTDGVADDAVAAFCHNRNISCFRGSEDDVLDRYYKAAKVFCADPIVRITADCPLLDPDVIDKTVQAYLDGRCDYASNVLVLSYPDGLDTEVFSLAALERAWREARLKSEREHVTPYIVNHADLFRQKSVEHQPDLSRLRWTVDEPRDLEFVRSVYRILGYLPRFGLAEILAVLEQHPELTEVNQGIEHNEGYGKSLREDSLMDRRDTVSGSGQRLYVKAKCRIPGGTQLLSKRPEMYLPEHWPSYYQKAQGVEVWDLDGNKYVDMSYNGIAACILGAADPDVDAAVREAIAAGSMSTLNAPEEVELAEVLCELHPWAEMVRYARCGGEAMAVAVRIARAHTRRDRIAFCGYHGWHDWYLSANLAEDTALDGHLLPGLEPVGVPRALQGVSLPFRYNHLEDLESIVAKHGEQLAAIVMEPIRGVQPVTGFLEGCRQIADEVGAILVFDEVSAGFRLTAGGAHLVYGLAPDIAVFAKAMSNGYAMAAIIGRGRVMQSAQYTFCSSTYWTERLGPAAALATIRKHRRFGVEKHLRRIGEMAQAGWREAAQQASISCEVGGIPALAHFAFQGEERQAVRTLFTQLMLERGYLATVGFYPTLAHQEHHVREYLKAVTEVFTLIAEAIKHNRVSAMLKGPVAHAGFTRLTS